TKSHSDLLDSTRKWVPYNKGGSRKQWYGNYDYIVNWENDGYEIKNFTDSKGNQRSRPQNTEYYFREAITWSLITSGGFSIRYRSPGSIHDVIGMSAFSKKDDFLLYILGLTSTKISDYIFDILNPTLALQAGDFKKMPIIKDDNYNEKINSLVNQSVELSRRDWDSFETSWDFEELLLVEYLEDSMLIQDSYNNWVKVIDEHFNKLKKNEEELNKIFIDIYGLQDELTPEVSDRDITLTKIYDNAKDIPEEIKGNQ